MTTACIKEPLSPESVGSYVESQSDEAILLEYRKTGDEALFSELVRRYEQELYAFLYRRFDNATLAEDAFQMAFLRVHMRAGQFEEGRKFRPWLYTIATNSAVDMLRRNRRRPTASLNTPLGGDEGDDAQLLDTLQATGPRPSDRIEAQEREAECRRAVTRLPERIRIVVDLVFLQGLKYREAAEVLSIPIGTVKSRLHQAMLKLRSQMNEGNDGGGQSRHSARRSSARSPTIRARSARAHRQDPRFLSRHPQPENQRHSGELARTLPPDRLEPRCVRDS